MFCREHVVQLHRESDRIKATGAELVVIGSGTPNFIKGFRENTKFDGRILSDPSLKSYDAAKLHRSMWRVFHPLVAVYGARALARGHMQGATQGDAAQQGGVYVIVPPERIAYVHISQRAGDNAPADEVVTALENARKSAA
jgi:peroxiredoxin